MASLKIPLSWIQFALYGLVGIITLCLDVGAFLLFLRLFDPQVAAVLSFCLSIICNYLLCFTFVFDRGDRPIVPQLMRFGLVVGVSILWHACCFWMLIHFAHLSPFWAKLIAIPTGVIWNYWGRRTIVFSKTLPPRTQRSLVKIISDL